MRAALLPVGVDGQQPSLPTGVFITGANGFIARALAVRYRALGVEVRGMDLHPDRAAGVIFGNLSEPQAWCRHAEGCDLFINTAAVVSMNGAWEEYRTVSVRGVRHALDVAISVGAKRFVHLSSIAAGGWQLPDHVDESWPVWIGEEYRYGVAKGASEHVVLAAHSAGEMNCTIVRPGDVYGPGARVWIELMLEMCRAGELSLPDAGRGMFGPTYIDDLVDGILLAAGLEGGRGQIFVIAGAEWVSAATFFSYHRRWAGQSGEPASLSLETALQAAGLEQRRNQILGKRDETCPDLIRLMSRSGSYSIDKARRLLGYQPKVTLQEGMRRAEEWLRTTGSL